MFHINNILRISEIWKMWNLVKTCLQSNLLIFVYFVIIFTKHKTQNIHTFKTNESNNCCAHLMTKGFAVNHDKTLQIYGIKVNFRWKASFWKQLKMDEVILVRYRALDKSSIKTRLCFFFFFFFYFSMKTCCGYSLEAPQICGYSLEAPHWGASNEHMSSWWNINIFGWKK